MLTQADSSKGCSFDFPSDRHAPCPVRPFILFYFEGLSKINLILTNPLGRFVGDVNVVQLRYRWRLYDVVDAPLIQLCGPGITALFSLLGWNQMGCWWRNSGGFVSNYFHAPLWLLTGVFSS
jgi:hypothetical protein